MKEFRKGIVDGIPIALGYISVSFTFGLMAVAAGMKWWQALLISMTNLTSAGQFAGLEIIAAGGTYIEMALSQLIINLRYALMSLSLSQKVDAHFHTGARLLAGVAITDEIFAVAMNHKRSVPKTYMAGLIAIPFLGWSGGTLAGALLGGILPEILQSALGIAIYGMFIAIIIPKIREGIPYLLVIVLALLMSCGFRWIPFLSKVSTGFAIIICAVVASLAGAIVFPIAEEEEE